jgi:hypothetical protein
VLLFHWIAILAQLFLLQESLLHLMLCCKVSALHHHQRD